MVCSTHTQQDESLRPLSVSARRKFALRVRVEDVNAGAVIHDHEHAAICGQMKPKNSSSVLLSFWIFSAFLVLPV